MGTRVPYQQPSSHAPLLAFIAEAPSNEELLKGRPLVGPSGRIFNGALRSAGIAREDCLITNVFDEKLPDNNVRNWCAPMKEARAMGVTDIPPIGDNGFLLPQYRWHLDRLAEELRQWDPVVCVPLGGTALWALTGQTGITAMRGQLTPATRVARGVKLLPTFHPAAVMHQWKFLPVVVGDLIKAQAAAKEGRDIVLPRRELILDPTLGDISRFVEAAAHSRLLSVDIETGWGQITCIGFAASAEHAICIPFFDRRKVGNSYWGTLEEERDAWGYVRTMLEGDVPKLGQNFSAYDAYWLLEKYHIAPRNLLHDTRLLQHALYPELPKDLEFMGNSYGTQGSWKLWGRKSTKKDD